MEYSHTKPPVTEKEPAKDSTERPAKPIIRGIGRSALEVATDQDTESSSELSVEAQAHIESFITFYEETYRGLLYYAARMLNDIYSAEDAVSEAMLAVFAKWSELKMWLHETDGKRRLQGYAYGTVKNIVFGAYRRRQRQVVMPEPIDSEAPTIDSPESYVNHWHIEKLISQLPLQQERVTRMTMIGATNEEIAQILGITQSSVRTHLANARRTLKPLVQDGIVF